MRSRTQSLAPGEEHHDHEGVDPHILLGPTQAKVIAKAIASELGKLDPANQARYEANLAAFDAKVDAKTMKSKLYHIYAQDEVKADINQSVGPEVPLPSLLNQAYL